MKFTTTNVTNFQACLDKLERYFAYKYGVVRKSVGFIINSKIIHVLIDGKLKESIRPSTLNDLIIIESTGHVTAKH